MDTIFSLKIRKRDISDEDSVLGAYKALSDPQDYHDLQLPTILPSLTSIDAGTTIVTMQMGNVLLLLGALAVICTWTPHPEIARYYLMAVACGDLGHIAGVYFGGMGNAIFDFGSYNGMAWGNVGVSAFLFVNRVATVMGLYGSIRNTAAAKKAKGM